MFRLYFKGFLKLVMHYFQRKERSRLAILLLRYNFGFQSRISMIFKEILATWNSDAILWPPLCTLSLCLVSRLARTKHLLTKLSNKSFVLEVLPQPLSILLLNFIWLKGRNWERVTKQQRWYRSTNYHHLIAIIDILDWKPKVYLSNKIVKGDLPFCWKSCITSLKNPMCFIQKYSRDIISQ